MKKKYEKSPTKKEMDKMTKLAEDFNALVLESVIKHVDAYMEKQESIDTIDAKDMLVAAAIGVRTDMGELIKSVGVDTFVQVMDNNYIAYIQSPKFLMKTMEVSMKKNKEVS